MRKGTVLMTLSSSRSCKSQTNTEEGLWISSALVLAKASLLLIEPILHVCSPADHPLEQKLELELVTDSEPPATSNQLIKAIDKNQILQIKCLTYLNIHHTNIRNKWHYSKKGKLPNNSHN